MTNNIKDVIIIKTMLCTLDERLNFFVDKCYLQVLYTHKMCILNNGNYGMKSDYIWMTCYFSILSSAMIMYAGYILYMYTYIVYFKIIYLLTMNLIIMILTLYII